MRCPRRICDLTDRVCPCDRAEWSTIAKSNMGRHEYRRIALPLALQLALEFALQLDLGGAGKLVQLASVIVGRQSGSVACWTWRAGRQRRGQCIVCVAERHS